MMSAPVMTWPARGWAAAAVAGIGRVAWLVFTGIRQAARWRVAMQRSLAAALQRVHLGGPRLIPYSCAARAAGPPVLP